MSELIWPGKLEDAITTGLIEITRVLDLADPHGACFGVFGGPHGYGHDYTGPVFDMRIHSEDPPDCTCGLERRLASWKYRNRNHTCGEYVAWQLANPHAVDCADKPNFRHHRTGVEVRWHKYIGRDQDVYGAPTLAQWVEILAECIAEVTTIAAALPQKACYADSTA